MKLSKEFLIKELKTKTTKELAIEIVEKQLGSVPSGYQVQFDATVKKYQSMLENLVLTEARLN